MHEDILRAVFTFLSLKESATTSIQEANKAIKSIYKNNNGLFWLTQAITPWTQGEKQNNQRFPVSFRSAGGLLYQLIELVLCFKPRWLGRGPNGFQLGLCVCIKSSSGKVAAKSNHLVRPSCRVRCEVPARDGTNAGGAGRTWRSNHSISAALFPKQDELREHNAAKLAAGVIVHIFICGAAIN